jgi:hypothetical protein
MSLPVTGLAQPAQAFYKGIGMDDAALGTAIQSSEVARTFPAIDARLSH